MMKRKPIATRDGQKNSSPVTLTNFHLLLLSLAMSLGVVAVIFVTLMFAMKPAHRQLPVSGFVTPAVPAKAIALQTAVASQVLTPVVSKAPSDAVQDAAVTEFFDYLVKDGDTLIRIARRTCTDYPDIAATNHIANPDNIYPNQLLKLKKVEHCTPETAKLKASPEVHNTPRVVASRDKQFVPVPASDSAMPARVAQSVAVFQGDCAKVVWKIKDQVQKIVIRTKCIEEYFGQHIRDAIAEIDPSLSYDIAVAFIDVESSGSPTAWNAGTDCHGLTQLQSPTAKHFGVRNMYDPRENIFGGIRVLSAYTRLFAGLADQHLRGLIGYNAGPYTNVAKHIDRTWLYKPGYDPRRHDYVQKVLAVLDIMHKGYASSKSTGTEVISRAANAADDTED